MALTPKRLRFVQEYLIDFNATQAATRAGYSAKTAKQQGQRLLTFVDVQKAIAEAGGKQAEKLDLSVERVLRGLFEEATRHGEGTSHAARVSAWGLLGKYHSLFTDKIDAKVTHDVSEDAARDRLFDILSRRTAARGAGESPGKPH